MKKINLKRSNLVRLKKKIQFFKFKKNFCEHIIINFFFFDARIHNRDRNFNLFKKLNLVHRIIQMIIKNKNKVN